MLLCVYAVTPLNSYTNTRLGSNEFVVSEIGTGTIVMFFMIRIKREIEFVEDFEFTYGKCSSTNHLQRSRSERTVEPILRSEPDS